MRHPSVVICVRKKAIIKKISKFIHDTKLASCMHHNTTHTFAYTHKPANPLQFLIDYHHIKNPWKAYEKANTHSNEVTTNRTTHVWLLVQSKKLKSKFSTLHDRSLISDIEKSESFDNPTFSPWLTTEISLYFELLQRNYDICITFLFKLGTYI